MVCVQCKLLLMNEVYRQWGERPHLEWIALFSTYITLKSLHIGATIGTLPCMHDVVSVTTDDVTMSNCYIVYTAPQRLQSSPQFSHRKGSLSLCGWSCPCSWSYSSDLSEDYTIYKVVHYSLLPGNTTK